MPVYNTKPNSLNIAHLFAWGFDAFYDGFNLFPPALHCTSKHNEPLLHYTPMKHVAPRRATSNKGDMMGQTLISNCNCT